MLNVAIMPELRDGNPYLDLLADALGSEGANVYFDDLPTRPFGFTLYRLSHWQTQVAHVHWIASLIMALCWSRSPILFSIKLALLWLDLRIARLLGLRIVWTIHNRFAHQGFDKQREKQIRRVFFNGVNHSIVHSSPALIALTELYGETLLERSSVIPHGNYDGVYPQPSDNTTQLRRNKGLDERAFVLLYFGAIRPHKGLNVLRDAYLSARHATDPAWLVIAGNLKDPRIREELEQDLGRLEHTYLDLRYVPDQDLIDYLSIADGVVVPFSDTLTSGSVLLAMTRGKGLILPTSAKVLGVVPGEGAMYFADSEALTRILSDLDRQAFIEMGKANRLAADDLDWRDIARKTLAVYGGSHVSTRQINT